MTVAAGLAAPLVGHPFLDQALWSRFRAAETAEAFAAAWLALQCRHVEGATAGVLVLGEPDIGPFRPAAAWPDAGARAPELTGAAEEAIRQRQGLATGEGGRCVAAPLLLEGRLCGVAAVLLAPGAAPSQAMRQLQWGAGWIEALLRCEQMTAGGEARARMAAAFDLLGVVLEHADAKAAATALATELARRLEADPVSIGFRSRGHCRVRALSRAAWFTDRMSLLRDIGAAMDEAVDQRALILWPPRPDWEYRVTLADEELAAAHRAGAILTVPLRQDGEPYGALVIERPAGAVFEPATLEPVDAVAAVAGPVLAEKRANDRWLPARIVQSIVTQLKRLLGPGWFGRKLATAIAIASFACRIFITIGIALLIGGSFFMLGVLIAIWSLMLMLGVPLFKSLRFLFASLALRRDRGRAFGVTFGALAALLFAVPLPHATMAEGVVWVRGGAAVFAGADGVVRRLAAAPNAVLSPNDPILELEDPGLAGRVGVLAARVVELEAQHAMRDLSNPVRARITLEELTLSRADLALAREWMAQLTIRSRAAGRLSLHRPDDLVGRFVRKGELIGYVADFEAPVIRVVVPESEADLVLQNTRAVALRAASDAGRVLSARIERISPRLEETLPSLALGTLGGGAVLLDPTAPGRDRALGRFLQIDLAIEDGRLTATRFGERVFVRFAHEAEPVAIRFWRAIRRVFLRHFNI
ncbi:MAG TPA: GAF domain-containing protein [Falsiroseomonas sp.]|jgi:hypothetical protein|nr:GAF domain-containing protein [Falsiroseomonas sp.]